MINYCLDFFGASPLLSHFGLVDNLSFSYCLVGILHVTFVGFCLSLGCENEIFIGWMAFNSKRLSPTALETGKSRLKLAADLLSGEDPLPGSSMLVFSVSSRGESFWGSTYEDVRLIWRLHPQGVIASQ